MGENDNLGYTPPGGIPDTSAFGGKIPDGIYASKCIGWRINPNKPNNAWVEFVNMDYPDEGKFSMNMYLPTKEALNQKAAELKGSVPDEELKPRVLKAFFHYGQTMKAAGIPANIPIKESLDLLAKWEGRAVYENQPGFATKVAKILSAKEAKKATVSAQSMTDVPF